MLSAKLQTAAAPRVATRAVATRPSLRRSVRVAASAGGRDEQVAAKLLALPAAASAFLAAGNAQAATELMQLAAGDNRLGTIALLFVPAIGWVAFNMLSPLTNQLARMTEMAGEPAPKAAKAGKRRGVAGAVGLGAALSLAAAQSAEAATEIAQLAAGDNRLGTIALLFVPAIGWVAFNMLSPLTNQLARMTEMAGEPAPKAAKAGKRRGVAGAVGLGAALSLAAAQSAEAATEIAQLAAGDNRLGTIALLFVPAIGWVAFNMLSPLTNQLARMTEMAGEPAPKAAKAGKRRGVAGAVGLGAALSLAAAQSAEAATEIAQLAAGDNRFGTIALLFVPAIAWVGFNMLQPLNNQLNRMTEMAGADAPKAAKRR
ncbi:MAG: hypothetical protein J3K34DRAFT_203010 [Monoraphidium minutum]|nr:MAG: hypothetical protein J3K34DRAFT_203010 [Monoraphidium minutum]